MQRLAKYPKWRLLELDNYTGKLNNDVFQYLDNLRPPAEKIPEPVRYKQNPKIAKECLHHIKSIFDIMEDKTISWEERIKKKRIFEKDSLIRLHNMFPNAGFMKIPYKYKDRKTISSGETNEV